MKELSTTSSDLFNKVRSRFSEIKLGNADGEVTTNPEEARFFDLTYKVAGDELGSVNIKIDDTSLTIIYNESMLDGRTDDVRQDWYKFLRELRQFARRNLLTFDTRDITKSNLDQRDYQYLAQNSGENKMSESKLFGTSKTSYQDIGEAKIIVKHSQPVNYNIPAGRTQHIESIYIESANGERFRYPTRHLNGARAMAVHVANGGNPYDDIGGYITGLSEEMSKLRQFKSYTQRAGVMAEALGDLPGKVAERLESLKTEVAHLQKQGYYESFRESFAPAESHEVPEEMASQWVDALTIKTFNEELKAVFPYIYKLVSEKNSLTYDDLVAEDNEYREDYNHVSFIKGIIADLHGRVSADPEKFKQTVKAEVLPWANEDPEGFEQAFNAAYNSFYHISPNDENDEEDYTDYTMRQGELGSPDRFRQEGKGNNMFDQFVNAIEELATPEFDEQPNDLNELEAEECSQVSASPITQEVVEFIQSMYDSATGTFPRGEEGVKIACEKKFGEQAGQFAHFVVEKLSAGCNSTMQEEPANQTPAAVSTDLGEIERIRQLAGTQGI